MSINAKTAVSFLMRFEQLEMPTTQLIVLRVINIIPNASSPLSFPPAEMGNAETVRLNVVAATANLALRAVNHHV